MAAYFAVETAPVRLANTDDVLFQSASHGTHEETLKSLFDRKSADEGRFYFRLGVYREPYAIYSVRDPMLFSAIRTALLLSQFGLLGYLLSHLFRTEAVGWLFTLIALGALHIPSIFYPVLSYPAYSVGASASILSLIGFLKWRDATGGLFWLVCSSACFLLALLCHENFLVVALLFPWIDWATRPDESISRTVLRSLPIAAISACYVVVYLKFRAGMSVAYDGTQVSPNGIAALVSWARQTGAAIPGVELFLHRGAPYPTVGPLLKSGSELAAVISSTPAIAAVIAILGACTASALANRVFSAAPKAERVISVLLFAALLPNALPSLTSKYQESAHHRFYPYVYSFSSYCWMIASLVGALALVASIRRNRGDDLRSLQLMTFAFCALLFLSAAASNANTIRLLVGWFN